MIDFKYPPLRDAPLLPRPKACVNCVHYQRVERDAEGDRFSGDRVHRCKRPPRVTGFDLVTGDKRLEPVTEDGWQCRAQREERPGACGPDARHFVPRDRRRAPDIIQRPGGTKEEVYQP